MIKREDLIGKFKQALNDKWGYIWGTAGVKWTQARQDALDKTTDTDRAMGRKYGKKWIGHYVADCSGLFTWAFKQLGGTMYHGSNTMWDKYCTNKGELVSGKRDDGRELLPGTAVFTRDKETGKRGHVGLYIGDGKVIEAARTQDGVVTSKVTGKWTEWGELKGVEYDGGEEPVAKGYAIVTGTRLALRSAPTTQASVIMRVDTGEKVRIETPPASEWEYVSYNGKKGWMMKKFLKEGE